MLIFNVIRAIGDTQKVPNGAPNQSKIQAELPAKDSQRSQVPRALLCASLVTAACGPPASLRINGSEVGVTHLGATLAPSASGTTEMALTLSHSSSVPDDAFGVTILFDMDGALSTQQGEVIPLGQGVTIQSFAYDVPPLPEKFGPATSSGQIRFDSVSAEALAGKVWFSLSAADSEGNTVWPPSSTVDGWAQFDART